MNCWTVAYLLFVVVVRLGQPTCYLCEQQCSELADLYTDLLNFTKIFVQCEEADRNRLVSFIDKNNFTQLQSFSLKSPGLLTLNLTKFYNISYLNLSENNITFVNLSQFNAYHINISHNAINKVVLTFINLTQLDLSHNKIKDMSENIVKPNKLTHLYMQHNMIDKISDFSSHTLKYLDLSNNMIDKLEIGYCPALKQFIISENLITNIQNNIHVAIPNVESLNLSSNYLTKLDDYSFNLTNLLQLDLRNNKIHSLSQKCFSGLNKLQILDISLNRIQTVAPSTFQYLNSLFHLVVSENKELSSQDFGLLLATRRLKSVYASKTNQNKIPSSLTRSVRYLVLSFNNISQIQCGDLDSYPLLNSLNLASNKISYIEDDALGRLELLTSINLDDNLLLSVPHTLPNNLKYLFLHNNEIKSINDNDFTGLQQLTNLDLSNNLIEELRDGSFSQLYGLEKLNLSKNPINTLPSDSFSSLQNLKTLDLTYLSNLTECNQALCFPVPDYNQIQELHMKNSSVLVSTFLKDLAALKTFEQLITLDISFSNVTFLRKDFPNYLTRLTNLNVESNNLDCGLIQQMFIWSRLKEISKCVFIITEDHSKGQTLKKEYNNKSTAITSTNSGNVKQYHAQTNSYKEESLINNYKYRFNESNNDTKEYIYNENKSDAFNDGIESELLSNEAWYNNGSPGTVDAYSSETPTSHPGLFVLLLLPIAVVSTCLFLNYSRIKRNKNTQMIIEKDIEISNISSELW